MEFKDFVLEEGDLLDAIKLGVKSGIKAFKDKRKQQANKTVADKLLGAEGKELEVLIRQIVDDGFSIQNSLKPQKISDWLKESCTNTKQDASTERSHEKISQDFLN
jgi:hypothetical protein